jgi:hypothetical protein
MFLHFISYHGTLQNCKKYCAYVIILISFLVILQIHQYFFITKEKPDLISVIGIETDPSLLVSMIYADRSRTLSDKCNHSQASVFDTEKYAPASLIQAYPWLNSALFPIQSKSLMYCAIPKVASKTLVSLMMYVYVHDTIGYLNNNWTNMNVNRTQIEQLINIPKLVEQLRKVMPIHIMAVFLIQSFILERNSNPKHKWVDVFCFLTYNLSSYSSI